MNKNMCFLVIILVLSMGTETAKANDWGCEVLLCLSNPKGPTAVEECKPSIHRLWDHLRDGHEFPSCDMAKSDKGRSYAKQGFDFFDPCPPGTRVLARDEVATRGVTIKSVGFANRDSTLGPIFVGIGGGQGYLPWNRFDNRLRMKTCVGNKIGVTWRSNDGRTRYPVTIYDRIKTLSPYSSPNVIDVFINDAFYQRVRW